jgi:hypothetical protein
MSEEPDNLILRTLREMRAENQLFREELLAEIGSLRSDLQEQSRKIDKLSVDLLAVRGRVRNVEVSVETIARVISADADTP